MGSNAWPQARRGVYFLVFLKIWKWIFFLKIPAVTPVRK